MNYSKIRSAAYKVSIVSLVLIFLATTSTFVYAGTQASGDMAKIPSPTTPIDDTSSKVPTAVEAVAGSDTDFSLIDVTDAAANTIQQHATVRTIMHPLATTGAAKVEEIKKQKEEEEKKKQEEEEKKKQEEAEQAAAAAGGSASAGAVTYTYNGSVLTKSKGINMGPSGKESYYNLNMSSIVSRMAGYGYTGYAVRADGVKTLNGYVMVAANLNVHPRGSLVQTSLGTGLVCDTGGFAAANPTQLDIATAW